MKVHLIKDEGATEEALTEAFCYLNEKVEIQNDSKQPYFNCNIPNINTEYYSFVLDSSDDIIGIPNDEILLNPKKNRIFY